MTAPGPTNRPGTTAKVREHDLVPLGLPGDEDGPVFAEGWQAEAFATAHALADAGLFSWGEWVEALSAAIADAQAAGDPDLGDTYYDHWVAALESLCARKGLVDRSTVDAQTMAWHDAYLHTPHGEPVLLAADIYRQ